MTVQIMAAPKMGKIRVKAKLVKLTAVPMLKDIDNYSRALSVYEYELVDEGEEKKRLVVLKWSIWQRRVLDDLPSEVGDIELLEIVPFREFKEFSNDRIIGEVEDKSSILYLDIHSMPRADKQQEVLAGRGLSRRGVKKDWLFLNDDIRHMNAGEFWQEWEKGGDLDVLDVVLDFQRRLRVLGVELLLVPVPTKALVYRDYLVGEEPVETGGEMFRLLEKEGIAVLNLSKVFMDHRKEESRALFCRTDSHWSPEGCNVAARAIAEVIKKKDWYKGLAHREYEEGVTGLLEIRGDLLDEGSDELESLPIAEVMGGGKLIAKVQADSAVVLLGDSHTLVFGDDSEVGKKKFFGDGGGLADYLALHSQVAVDVVSSLGSGMNGARGTLYRSRTLNKEFANYWKSKKVVIWCFSEREFSDPTGLSLKIPVVMP